VKFRDDARKGTVEGEQNRRRELHTECEYRSQIKRLEERDAIYGGDRNEQWSLSSSQFWAFRLVAAVIRSLTRL
jgi:hypothetical protein